MYAKNFTAALFGAILFTAPAMAENAKAPPPGPANHQAQAQQKVSVGDLWRGSKIIGLNVYNEKNEKIGDINELLLDKQGKVETVVIGVGGFLGMGEHDVPVKFSELKWVNEPVHSNATSSANRPTTTTGAGAPPNARRDQNYPDHAVFNATKEQLKSMPEIKYNK